MALEVKSERSSAVSVFELGKLGVNVSSWKASEIGTSSPPKPLLIVRPTEVGEYPVVLFFHGYALCNCFYTDLFKHVASHGYIIVAPQLYHISPCKELDYAASVVNWLSEGLQHLLPQDVRPNLLKFALAGHSRGGRAAFAVALGKVQTSLKFSVLLGIDPVAGSSRECQVSPKILTYVPQSFDIDAPILLVGTGLGDKPKMCMMPACAPDGVNHKEFFNESRSPCCYFVAKEYGHMDMLDDDPQPKIIGKMTYCMCTNGRERQSMRAFVGGVIVAFLEAYWDGKNEDLKAILQDPDIAPVKLDTPICI
ncbi:hypothetical protein MRB53_020311 [Persea americana]|uniref:Uncharacterized protein n=1 Tax=Persea americana TaxID=3435 RepID=A0ACC2L0L4_PERAE|nr:hypothetical protein MRB53_020311 [Persea americana]